MDVSVSQQPSELQIEAETLESKLLLLPRELRDLIYHEVVNQLVDDDSDLFVYPSGVPDGTISVRKRIVRQDQSNCSRSGIVNLMQVNKCIYEELSEALYSRYTFKLWPFRNAYHGFLENIGEYQRRLIRHVSVEVDSYSYMALEGGARFESQRHIWDDIETPRIIRESLPGLKSVVCQAVWEDNPGYSKEGGDYWCCLEHLVYQINPFKCLPTLNLSNLEPWIKTDRIQRALEERRLQERESGNSWKLDTRGDLGNKELVHQVWEMFGYFWRRKGFVPLPD
ncbi:MAG: hypothetical protein M1831_006689 [Alyxoria varia]|nr:MAG: hypothetical protein M1831_006689 [Alyxoria varia]